MKIHQFFTVDSIDTEEKHFKTCISNFIGIYESALKYTHPETEIEIEYGEGINANAAGLFPPLCEIILLEIKDIPKLWCICNSKKH